MKTRIKRSELYRLVWSKPMIHIGEDLGVTGNGLKKICIKQNIPRPPAGYFQMSLENRRRVHRSLPNAESDPEILITGVLPNELAVGVDDVVLPESNDATVEKQIDAYIKHLRSNSTTGERGILYPRNQRPEWHSRHLTALARNTGRAVSVRHRVVTWLPLEERFMFYGGRISLIG